MMARATIESAMMGIITGPPLTMKNHTPVGSACGGISGICSRVTRRGEGCLWGNCRLRIIDGVKRKTEAARLLVTFYILFAARLHAEILDFLLEPLFAETAEHGA